MLNALWWLFQVLLATGGIVCLAIGLFLVFHIARPQRAPADTSNRINKIRLLWYCLTREDLFVDTFEWLKHDESDNINPYK
jgi:hypothetical protein